MYQVSATFGPFFGVPAPRPLPRTDLLVQRLAHIQFVVFAYAMTLSGYAIQTSLLYVYWLTYTDLQCVTSVRKNAIAWNLARTVYRALLPCINRTTIENHSRNCNTVAQDRRG
jgi:cytochrome b561